MDHYTFNQSGEIEIKLPIASSLVDKALEYRDNSSCYRVIYIGSGSGIVSINSKNYSYVAPTIFTLNSDEPFKFIQSSATDLKLIQLTPEIINRSFTLENIKDDHKELSQNEILDLYWLDSFLKRSEEFRGFYNLGPTTSQRVESILSQIDKQLSVQDDPYWPCRSRSFLFELLNLLNTIRESYCELVSIKKLDNPKISKVIVYLNENYSEKISVDDLTALVNINRTTLSKLFLEATGVTIVEYLTKLRVAISSTLLKDTALPVVEIAYRVGYNDITHFGRVFKKQMGVTPSKFREGN